MSPAQAQVPTLACTIALDRCSDGSDGSAVIVTLNPGVRMECRRFGSGSREVMVA